MLEIEKDIWEFDVDDTLVMWDVSKFRNLEVSRVVIIGDKGPINLVVNQKNVNLLVKLSKIGYYIRVHSGSGKAWAKKVVEALCIQDYVDSVETKPKGKTDDKPPGDGITYLAYRDPVSGNE